MRYQNFQRLNKALLMSILVIGLLLGWPTLTPPAIAAVSPTTELSEGITLQFQQTLQDQLGHTWQSTALHRLELKGGVTFYLRLESISGTVGIARDQPLTVITAEGLSLQAPNTSSEIFSDASPVSHLRQYDLSAILPQLTDHQPIRLSLSTEEGATREINVPINVIREWQTLSSCRALMCEGFGARYD